jgi:hypothetical protein
VGWSPSALFARLSSALNVPGNTVPRAPARPCTGVTDRLRRDSELCCKDRKVWKEAGEGEERREDEMMVYLKCSANGGVCVLLLGRGRDVVGWEKLRRERDMI